MADEPSEDQLKSLRETEAGLHKEREAARRAGSSKSEDVGGAREVVERVLATREPTSPSRLTDLVFAELTGIESDHLHKLLLGLNKMPERPVRGTCGTN